MPKKQKLRKLNIMITTFIRLKGKMDAVEISLRCLNSSNLYAASSELYTSEYILSKILENWYCRHFSEIEGHLVSFGASSVFDISRNMFESIYILFTESKIHKY